MTRRTLFERVAQEIRDRPGCPLLVAASRPGCCVYLACLRPPVLAVVDSRRRYKLPRGWTVRIRSATRDHCHLPSWLRRMIDRGAELAEFPAVEVFVPDDQEAPARIADLALARVAEVIRAERVAVG